MATINLGPCECCGVGACIDSAGICTETSKSNCDTNNGSTFYLNETCAGSTTCITQESGEVTGFPGSSVSFSDGGGSFKLLDYYGVYGYWLGSWDSGETSGPSQSVAITFGEKKPTSATVTVSALENGNLGQAEKFNYSFSGADTVTFTAEDGGGFTDTGSTVTRSELGPSRFNLQAEGVISAINVEGQMVDGGSNGVIVSVCVFYSVAVNPLP